MVWQLRLLTHAAAAAACRGRRSAADRIKVVGVEETLLWEAAEKTQGFSGEHGPA